VGSCHSWDLKPYVKGYQANHAKLAGAGTTLYLLSGFDFFFTDGTKTGYSELTNLANEVLYGIFAQGFKSTVNLPGPILGFTGCQDDSMSLDYWWYDSCWCSSATLINSDSASTINLEIFLGETDSYSPSVEHSLANTYDGDDCLDTLSYSLDSSHPALTISGTTG